jgi:hypothetical protein
MCERRKKADRRIVEKEEEEEEEEEGCREADSQNCESRLEGEHEAYLERHRGKVKLVGPSVARVLEGALDNALKYPSFTAQTLRYESPGE